MSRTTRTAALVLAAVGLAPAAADAATVERVSGRIVVNAAPGEFNNLEVTPGEVVPGSGEDGFHYQVFVEELNSTTPLTAGDGCSQTATRLVRCSTQDIRTWRLTANLGDRNDRLTSELGSFGIAADIDAFLGAGDDRFTATVASTGSDDYVEGGPGNDTISTGRRADEVHGDDGADVIYGGDSADRIEGGLGNDKIDGDLGDDDLFGQGGDDMIGQLVLQRTCVTCAWQYAFSSDPVYDGVDFVSGGENNDRLSTFDRGNDYLPSCGSGTDTLERDNGEQTPNGCESVTIRS